MTFSNNSFTMTLLLTIAGQCNSNGKLIIGENIPLNVQQLSKILGKYTSRLFIRSRCWSYRYGKYVDK